MSLNVELPPLIEGRLEEQAAREGVTPSELILNLVKNTFEYVIDTEKQKQLNASSIALLQQWLNESEPDDLVESEEALNEFKRNLNAPRRDAGARLLFPEVEVGR